MIPFQVQMDYSISGSKGWIHFRFKSMIPFQVLEVKLG
jgi:hypothetical protein